MPTTPTERRLALPHGTLILRERLPGPGTTGLPVLLLHGISSGAPSWDAVIGAVAAARPGEHLIAWDAPGYGASGPLADAAPEDDAYAAVAEAALQALDLDAPGQRLRLVGHSLGALVATALAVRLGPQRVADLLLLSPARGYGHDAAEAARVRQQRLGALATQGIAGLAATVSQRLLSARATAEQHQRVREVAQRLTPGGYAQAVSVLCSGRLAARASALAGIPVRVAVGSDDVVTPPDACAALAQALGARFSTVPGAGHALPVEQPDAVAALITAADAPDPAHAAPPATSKRP